MQSSADTNITSDRSYLHEITIFIVIILILEYVLFRICGKPFKLLSFMLHEFVLFRYHY